MQEQSIVFEVPGSWGVYARRDLDALAKSIRPTCHPARQASGRSDRGQNRRSIGKRPGLCGDALLILLTPPLESSFDERTTSDVSILCGSSSDPQRVQ